MNTSLSGKGYSNASAHTNCRWGVRSLSLIHIYPEIQFRSPEEIKAYQESRLAEELLYLCRLYTSLFAAQVRVEENVTSFFPDTKDSQNSINVFENLKIKDKIITVSYTHLPDNNDYICLTDMAHFKDRERTNYIIQNWMRLRSTIDFLG